MFSNKPESDDDLISNGDAWLKSPNLLNSQLNGVKKALVKLTQNENSTESSSTVTSSVSDITVMDYLLESMVRHLRIRPGQAFALLTMNRDALRSFFRHGISPANEKKTNKSLNFDVLINWMNGIYDTAISKTSCFRLFTDVSHVLFLLSILRSGILSTSEDLSAASCRALAATITTIKISYSNTTKNRFIQTTNDTTNNIGDQSGNYDKNSNDSKMSKILNGFPLWFWSWFLLPDQKVIKNMYNLNVSNKNFSNGDQISVFGVNDDSKKKSGNIQMSNIGTSGGLSALIWVCQFSPNSVSSIVGCIAEIVQYSDSNNSEKNLAQLSLSSILGQHLQTNISVNRAVMLQCEDSLQEKRQKSLKLRNLKGNTTNSKAVTSEVLEVARVHLEVLHLMMKPLAQFKKTRDIMATSEIISDLASKAFELINECSKQQGAINTYFGFEGETKILATLESQMNECHSEAVIFLCELWKCYPDCVDRCNLSITSSTTTKPGNNQNENGENFVRPLPLLIVNVLKSGARDTKLATALTSIACLFNLLDIFSPNKLQKKNNKMKTAMFETVQEKQNLNNNAGASSSLIQQANQESEGTAGPHIFKTLIFLLVESFSDDMTNHFLASNFVNVLRRNPGLPVNLVADPFTKQISLTGYKNNQLDMVVEIARHPKLGIKHAIQLLDFLIATGIHDHPFSHFVYVPIGMLLKRFGRTESVSVHIARCCSTSLGIVVQEELSNVSSDSCREMYVPPTIIHQRAILELLLFIINLHITPINEKMRQVICDKHRRYINTHCGAMHAGIASLLRYWGINEEIKSVNAKEVLMAVDHSKKSKRRSLAGKRNKVDPPQTNQMQYLLQGIILDANGIPISTNIRQLSSSGSVQRIQKNQLVKDRENVLQSSPKTKESKGGKGSTQSSRKNIPKNIPPTTSTAGNVMKLTDAKLNEEREKRKALFSNPENVDERKTGIKVAQARHRSKVEESENVQMREKLLREKTSIMRKLKNAAILRKKRLREENADGDSSADAQRRKKVILLLGQARSVLAQSKHAKKHLKTIFKEYAKTAHAGAADFSSIARDAKTLSYGEHILFLRDFKIVPGMMNGPASSELFNRTYRYTQAHREKRKAGDHEEAKFKPPEKTREMVFHQWLALLVQLAITCQKFSKLPTPMEKFRAFLRHLVGSARFHIANGIKSVSFTSAARLGGNVTSRHYLVPESSVIITPINDEGRKALSSPRAPRSPRSKSARSVTNMDAITCAFEALDFCLFEGIGIHLLPGIDVPIGRGLKENGENLSQLNPAYLQLVRCGGFFENISLMDSAWKGRYDKKSKLSNGQGFSEKNKFSFNPFKKGKKIGEEKPLSAKALSKIAQKETADRCIEAYMDRNPKADIAVISQIINIMFACADSVAVGTAKILIKPSVFDGSSEKRRNLTLAMLNKPAYAAASNNDASEKVEEKKNRELQELQRKEKAREKARRARAKKLKAKYALQKKLKEEKEKEAEIARKKAEADARARGADSASKAKQKRKEQHTIVSNYKREQDEKDAEEKAELSKKKEREKQKMKVTRKKRKKTFRKKIDEFAKEKQAKLEEDQEAEKAKAKAEKEEQTKLWLKRKKDAKERLEKHKKKKEELETLKSNEQKILKAHSDAKKESQKITLKLEEARKQMYAAEDAAATALYTNEKEHPELKADAENHKVLVEYIEKSSAAAEAKVAETKEAADEVLVIREERAEKEKELEILKQKKKEKRIMEARKKKAEEEKLAKMKEQLSKEEFEAKAAERKLVLEEKAKLRAQEAAKKSAADKKAAAAEKLRKEKAKAAAAEAQAAAAADAKAAIEADTKARAEAKAKADAKAKRQAAAKAAAEAKAEAEAESSSSAD